MSTIIKQEGDVLAYANSSGSPIANNTVFLSGNHAFVPLCDIPNGQSGSVATECVVAYAKDTGAGTGGVFGATAYWDNTNHKFTGVSTDNTLVGYFAAACADGDATCEVKLLG